MRCPKCNTVWPDELAGVLKFCGACSAPMAPDRLPGPPPGERPAAPQPRETHYAPGGELRFVTVLFADLAGFTAFAEDRPPDEVAKIVGDLLQSLGRVVERHGGAVDKFLGDAVVATFGLPRPDPSAARNAVRAGLAMQECAVQFNRQHGLSFGLRVGIHAGEVMFRDIGGSWTVMGDTVNTASRIQNAAPSGKVWISRPVYEEVRRFFTLVTQPAIELKGKKHSIQPYEVVDERSVPFANLPGFVGREPEWEALQTALRQAVDGCSLKVVVIRGPAGIGKSRLVWELRDWVQKESAVYRIDVVQYDHSTQLPAHGLNTLIRSRFKLPLDLDESALLARLRQALTEEYSSLEGEAEQELAIEFFAFVLGILRPDFRIFTMDGKNRWEGAFVEIKAWLESKACQEPWIFILEDAQKGDADTAAFLSWAMQARLGQPVLAVVTVRDEDFGPYCHWYEPLTGWLQSEQADEIRLREIPSEVLAQALTTMMDGAVSPAAAQHIAEHTEGNPLFAIELVLLLRDEGLLGSEINWAKVSLPGSVREVMEARIERLGLNGKEVAKRGALMGRRFTQEAVEKIWDGSPADLANGLVVLQETETVYEEASRLFFGEMEQVFRHGRLQEAILARIPRDERLRWLKGLEAWACERLERSGRQWEGTGALLIPLIARAREEQGDHWEASLWYEILGRLHHRHNREKDAIQFLRRAQATASGTRDLVLRRQIAEAEVFTGAVKEALQTAAYGHAGETTSLHLLPESIRGKLAGLSTSPLDDWNRLSPAEAAAMLELTRADILTQLGRVSEAHTAYEIVGQVLAGLQGTVGQILWLRWGRLWVSFLTELLLDPTAAENVCRQMHQRVDLHDPALADERVNFLAAEALSAVRLGRFEPARAIIKEQLELAQSHGNLREESGAWNSLGMSYDALGDLSAAEQCYQKAINLSRKIGFRRREVIALHNLGLVYQDQCNWEAARRHQEQYIALSRLIGNHLAESYGPAYLGVIAMEQGEFARAEEQIEIALQTALENNWTRLVGLCHALRGHLRFRRWLAGGERAELDRAVEELLSFEEAWSHLDEAGEVYANLALALFSKGDVAAAAAALRRARSHVDQSWLAARHWLEAAEAVISGASLDAPLGWFLQHGFFRAIAFFQRPLHPHLAQEQPGL